ncbi:hypothetical protein CROQUDRAFT_45939 [Cronartium quercuum f. sp. fusiforme G11]|uniref:Zinc finger Mcm10/DnaG-type domain-containing protein n=1 Tax=Cronartium quercuum f. sp. fusiforme G11 TaxID=708437 RepID=A0A9P6NJK9_9BASI|nr:hypothetical protein CROQUDRAFT_45939 [Cronartium quercuum f. sp. fusiforme G11]
MFPSSKPVEKKKPEVRTISKTAAEAEIQKLKRYVAELEEKEKENQRCSNVLVPCSPSPRKKKRTCQVIELAEKQISRAQPVPTSVARGVGAALPACQDSADPRDALLTSRPKSTLMAELETVRTSLKTNATVRTVPRNTSFSEPHLGSSSNVQPSPFCSTRVKASGAPAPTTSKPIQPAQNQSEPQADSRASDLTLRTEIPLGPVTFRPPLGDADFDTLEPNSNVRLKKRLLSHADLQEHLHGRHLVRINELYSIIRKLDNGKSKGGTEWDVPLVGDWVLFAVIGEKGDFKLTNPQVDHKPVKPPPKGKGKASAGDENDDDLDARLRRDEETQDARTEAEFSIAHRTRKRKHYVNLKLVDLSSKAVSQSGSGIVNMLLFESEEEILTETVDADGAPTVEKSYRGGSGGAYEKFWKEQPGTLLAILNPKVLKSRPLPNRGTGTLDVLSITPEKAASVMVIGRARDLGNCTAKRLDTGQVCGSWCDLRTSGGAEDDEDVSKSLSVCEFHLQRQISKTRAGRAEFFASTSGMTKQVGTNFNPTSMRKNGKSKEYDPVKKIGLLPATTSKGARVINGQVTYVCPGNMPNPTRPSGLKKDRWDQPLDAEKMDRLRRRRTREMADKELKALLKHEGGEKNPSLGGQYLLDAQRLLNAKQKKADQAASDGQPSNAKNASSKPRQTFDDTLVQAIGHDPTSLSKQLVREPLTSEDRSSMFLDLLGKDGPVKTIGPETLRSADAKYGARVSIPQKKPAAQTVPVKPIMVQEEEEMDGESGSDSDDSLIVLPPS